jgi:tRNA (mo5U34)-methyltransferase
VAAQSKVSNLKGWETLVRRRQFAARRRYVFFDSNHLSCSAVTQNEDGGVDMSEPANAAVAEWKRRAAESQWFHAIDFGDFASSGRFQPGMPQNITLFGFMDMIQSIDLDGMSVLDVRAADGLASFGMKKLGAAKVTAIDSYDLPTFRFAREILGLDIDYRPGVQVKDAVRELGEAQFDLILCAGVIYHMLNPFSAVINCRRAVKEGGLVILESPVTEKTREAVMFLNSEASGFKELYTYWVPTEQAMIGMLKLASFNIVATRRLQAPARLTVLAEATTPDRVADRSELLTRIHEVDTCDFEFRLADVIHRTERSAIKVGPIERHSVIDADRYQPVFPLQPSAGKVGLGKTRWVSKTKNY